MRRQRDDPHLVRAKDVKRPWIGMKLGVIDYQNYFGTRCDADAGATASQPTADRLGKRSQ
jgi:hypothetical protein